MTNGSLMKVESIAECSKGSILQYFWPSLKDNWSWKLILVFLRVARFTQVFLYLPNQQYLKHTLLGSKILLCNFMI